MNTKTETTTLTFHNDIPSDFAFESETLGKRSGLAGVAFGHQTCAASWSGPAEYAEYEVVAYAVDEEMGVRPEYEYQGLGDDVDTIQLTEDEFKAIVAEAEAAWAACGGKYRAVVANKYVPEDDDDGDRRYDYLKEGKR